MEVGDEILIRAKIVKKEKDPDYPFQMLEYSRYEFNAEFMYEVEVQPEWEAIYLRGNMLDKVEVVSED